MKCEKCGKEHDGSYGSGRFCSTKCARGFSSSNRSLESRQKTAKSVAKEHIHTCPICGKSFLNKGTAPNALCLNCKAQKQIDNSKKHRYSNSNQFKINLLHNKIEVHCKYCGAIKHKCKRPEICKHYQLFPKMIQLFHMDPNSIGSEQLYIEFDRISNEIYDLYWNKKLSIQQIKELIGYKSTAGSLAHFLSKFITFRNISESIENALQNGRLKIIPIECQNFKTGFHTTWNGKQYFYRSSYEEDYCKELDLQKIDYEIETLTIPYFDTQLNRIRTAFPDFYIPDKNLIVEVKSSYTLNAQNMIDRFIAFKKLGYNVDLLYEHKHYPDMSFFGLS